MALLNNKQKEALDFVGKGHNLLLLGSAGTGKTFLVKQMLQQFQDKGLTYAVTATTGIASSRYENGYSPMTIHRWSGIGVGRYDPAEIKRIVSNNIKFTDVLNRITSTDVLVIDEVSMLSRRFFDSLNAVLFYGDFRQLPPPPVPCSRYGEDAAFCFESDLFCEAFPHRISLTEVVRQDDVTMVQVIKEISEGRPSQETLTVLGSLARPLSCEDDEDTIKLVSTNDLADDFNRDRIADYPGPLYTYSSADTGDKKCLKDIMACKTLWLKLGMPVILIKNLSNKLINGLRGTVYDVTEDGKIIMEFQHMKEMAYIERVKFEVFDPRKNATVAT